MTILTDDMKRVIKEQSLGFVATVCPDGSPNLSPKGTMAVWDDGSLIFADLASPNTMANILVNPVVEVNVVDPVRRTGYRFRGRASVHQAGPVFDQAVRSFEEHGVDANRIHGVGSGAGRASGCRAVAGICAGHERGGDRGAIRPSLGNDPRLEDRATTRDSGERLT
jgi:uncharacterized protein